jgi:hypothetical protein
MAMNRRDLLIRQKDANARLHDDIQTVEHILPSSSYVRSWDDYAQAGSRLGNFSLLTAARRKKS